MPEWVCEKCGCESNIVQDHCPNGCEPEPTEFLAPLLLQSLHIFNKLDEQIVNIIGDVMDVDAEKICREHGIVYKLTEPNSDILPKINEIVDSVSKQGIVTPVDEPSYYCSPSGIVCIDGDMPDYYLFRPED